MTRLFCILLLCFFVNGVTDLSGDCFFLLNVGIDSPSLPEIGSGASTVVA